MNRRQLLRTATTLTKTGMASLQLAPAPARDILICVFLRGGADGLNMVVPHGDEQYYAQRRSLAIPSPKGAGTAIDLDGFFGLHPALEPLQAIWDAKQLAIVQAVGSPDPTKSHFDAMDYMERGTPGQKSLASGWLGRHLAQTQSSNDTPLRAVGFGALLPASLRGGLATAINSLDTFQLRANAIELPQIRAAHGQIYRGSNLLAGAGQQTLTTVDLVQKVAGSGAAPTDGATYPDSPYGKALQQIARLIKADVGVQIACADIGDWDTHVNQGGVEGEMATNLRELADGLRALYTDLSAFHNRVTIVTMSEFGRRVAENGTGTDHGHGNVMLVMGGNTLGGQIYGDWPGLNPEQLFGRGDLAITTDFRDILGEIMQKRLGNAALDQLFPGYATFTFRGVVKG